MWSYVILVHCVHSSRPFESLCLRRQWLFAIATPMHTDSLSRQLARLSCSSLQHSSTFWGSGATSQLEGPQKPASSSLSEFKLHLRVSTRFRQAHWQLVSEPMRRIVATRTHLTRNRHLETEEGSQNYEDPSRGKEDLELESNRQHGISLGAVWCAVSKLISEQFWQCTTIFSVSLGLL